MEKVEFLILRNLLYNEEYVRKVIPFIKAKTHKSRLSKENKQVDIRLYFDERGLDKYYGLLELGEIGGLWKNVAGRYEMNGKKIYAKPVSYTHLTLPTKA